MEQGEHSQDQEAQPRNIASVTKISRAEIDRILRDAIRRDSKYVRFPTRSNGHSRGQTQRDQPTS